MQKKLECDITNKVAGIVLEKKYGAMTHLQLHLGDTLELQGKSIPITKSMNGRQFVRENIDVFGK